MGDLDACTRLKERQSYELKSVQIYMLKTRSSNSKIHRCIWENYGYDYWIFV